MLQKRMAPFNFGRAAHIITMSPLDKLTPSPNRCTASMPLCLLVLSCYAMDACGIVGQKIVPMRFVHKLRLSTHGLGSIWAMYALTSREMPTISCPKKHVTFSAKRTSLNRNDRD